MASKVTKEIDNKALDKFIETMAVKITIRLIPILACIFLLGIVMGYVIWGLK